MKENPTQYEKDIRSLATRLHELYCPNLHKTKNPLDVDCQSYFPDDLDDVQECTWNYEKWYSEFGIKAVYYDKAQRLYEFFKGSLSEASRAVEFLIFISPKVAKQVIDEL